MAEKPHLFASTAGWNIKKLPEPFNGWGERLSDVPEGRSHLNTHRKYSTLNLFVTKAIISYASGPLSQMALVEVGKGSYAAERKTSDGSTAIFKYPANGKLHGAVVTTTGRHTVVPQLGSKSDYFDLSPVFLMLLPVMAEKDQEMAEALELVRTEYQATGEWNKNAVYRINDAMYHGIQNDVIKCSITGGNVSLLTEQAVQTGSLNGKVICGCPMLLQGVGAGVKSKKSPKTMKEAKAEFQSWAAQHNWTAEEQDLIPAFPDDFPVPPEVIKIATRYIKTNDSRRPMRNFLWRGITSYGKSTGVEIMAAFLNMPLLRVTCHSTMETQNFLSDFVPDNGTASFTADLPTFDEMAFDPETAYFKLTGKEDGNATSEMCLTAYADAVAARGSNVARFKHVESNFVRALRNGYIVEVQEISRIKDSGVLVGLNEFDRPGAIIPLVDGTTARRHPNAMVVYSDNVGYVSCRPVDPSVIRRMAFVLDSYELPKEDAIARVMYNTQFPDKALLEQMYDVWDKIAEFCKDREITDGSISVTELEMWAQSTLVDGMNSVYDNCIDCVVSKATSDIDEQKQIIASVLQVHLTF